MDFNQYLKDRPRNLSRGAPMGNNNSSNLVADEDNLLPYKFGVQKLRFVDGDYTLDGTYWGKSPNSSLYLAMTDDCATWMYVRAVDREAAKKAVKSCYPNAKFYG